MTEQAKPSVKRFLLHVAGGAGLAALITGVGILVGAPVPWFAAAATGMAPGTREASKAEREKQTKAKTALDILSWVVGGIAGALLSARVL